jgi:hypothetical protein
MPSNDHMFTCSCQEELRTRGDVDRHDKRWFELGHDKQCRYPGCQTISPQTSNAKRHWRTHLPERLGKYFCPKCDTSYVNPEQLKKHEAAAFCRKNRKRCRSVFEEEPAPAIPSITPRNYISSPNGHATEPEPSSELPSNDASQPSSTIAPSPTMDLLHSIQVPQAYEYSSSLSPIHSPSSHNVSHHHHRLPDQSSSSEFHRIDYGERRHPSPVPAQEEWELLQMVTPVALDRLAQQQKKETAQAEMAQRQPQLQREPISTTSPKYAHLGDTDTDRAAPFQNDLPDPDREFAAYDIPIMGNDWRERTTWKVELFGRWVSAASLLSECANKALPEVPDFTSLWRAIVDDMIQGPRQRWEHVFDMHCGPGANTKLRRTTWLIVVETSGDRIVSNVWNCHKVSRKRSARRVNHSITVLDATACIVSFRC